MHGTGEMQQLSVLTELNVIGANGPNFALNLCQKDTTQMEFTPVRAAVPADQQQKEQLLKDKESFHFVSLR